MIIDSTLRINVAEYDMVRTFTLRQISEYGDVSEINMTDDEARRVWEAFAPYFDGREVADV